MATPSTHSRTTLAKVLAAEEVRPDDYVAVLNEIHEYPSFLWPYGSEWESVHEPVSVRWRSFDSGMPLRVLDLCLPFVLVKRPTGKRSSLDLRSCQLVRLDRAYAKRVWKVMKKTKKWQ